MSNGGYIEILYWPPVRTLKHDLASSYSPEFPDNLSILQPYELKGCAPTIKERAKGTKREVACAGKITI